MNREFKIEAITISRFVIGIIILTTAIILTISSLFSIIVYNMQIENVYDEMGKALAGEALTQVDIKEVRTLATECNDIYQAYKDPKASYDKNPEAFEAGFRSIADSARYMDLWNHLNELRRGSNSTAFDLVLFYPDENLGIYIIDASDANILPCGNLFTINLDRYFDHKKNLFLGFYSFSKVYGKVRTSGKPVVIDPANDVYCFLTADIPTSIINTHIMKYIMETGFAGLLIGILISIGSLGILRKQILKPLKKITFLSERFVDGYEARSGVGEDSHVFLDTDMGSIREIKELMRSLQSMEREMNSYLRSLDAASRESSRITTELDIGAKIQAAALPELYPDFSDRAEYEIAASMMPAKLVGGDFFDFFYIDPDHLALVIADVSGKGVPAAMLMMSAKITIKDRALGGGTPAEILAYANDQLCKNNATEMFVTVWMGILTISTGKIVAANAGHEYPAIRKKNFGFELLKDRHGLVVGAMEGIRYHDYEILLEPGDAIYLYTDGITEASNSDYQLFGKDRMLAALNQKPGGDSNELIREVTAQASRFTGNEPQFDDMTQLCVIYKGTESMKKERYKEIIIDAQIDKLPQVLAFLGEMLDEIDCSLKARMQLEIAVEEIFVNIASYAYEGGEGKATIRCSYDEEDEMLSVMFRDSGSPFDPISASDPDVHIPIDDRQIGGLGIFMVKKSMDEVIYEREGGENILTIRKKTGLPA